MTAQLQTTAPTSTLLERGYRVEVDEFWTSRQRQGHSLHEISYRACFKSQLPEYFIKRYTVPGDSVLDPFMGRGTTPLQAHLMGRRAFGSDINPLCVMLARPRFNPPSLAQIESRLHEIPLDAADIPAEDAQLTVFYHLDTLRQLVAYKRWFAARAASGQFDNIDDWIRMVCINRLSGHSSGFFSVRTMPPNQAVSLKRQRIINERNNQTPEPKDTRAIILRKSRSLLRSFRANGSDAGDATPIPKTAPDMAPVLEVCDSADLSHVPDSSIDLVVTSPPFLDVVDYKGDNWLRCWFAGIDPAQLSIDEHGTVPSWKSWVRKTFVELARFVRVGGFVAFEVGEVKNGSVQLEEVVIESVSGLPWEVDQVLINLQSFTKTSNLWGVDNNRRGTNTNRIALLRRIQ